MHVTLTNVGPTTVPVFAASGVGLAEALDPGESLSIDDPEIVVASVGDNPTFVEEFQEALAGFMAAVKALLDKLRDWWGEIHPDDANVSGPTPVSVEIQNHGPNALRVCLGSNTNDVQVEPGDTYVAEADRYVEIRELGV